jgi:hypothetical protein
VPVTRGATHGRRVDCGPKIALLLVLLWVATVDAVVVGAGAAIARNPVAASGPTCVRAPAALAEAMKGLRRGVALKLANDANEEAAVVAREIAEDDDEEEDAAGGTGSAKSACSAPGVNSSRFFGRLTAEKETGVRAKSTTCDVVDACSCCTGCTGDQVRRIRRGHKLACCTRLSHVHRNKNKDNCKSMLVNNNAEG